MTIARTIIAFLIAVSVAMLPMAAVACPKSAGAAVSPMADGCDSPQPKPGDKAGGDCALMIGCALKCFNFSAAGAGGSRALRPSRL